MTDEIRPLTAEEKEMLGLSPERVEGLALADGAERRSEIASITTRFTNALKDKARLIEKKEGLLLIKSLEKSKVQENILMNKLKARRLRKHRLLQPTWKR